MKPDTVFIVFRKLFRKVDPPPPPIPLFVARPWLWVAVAGDSTCPRPVFADKAKAVLRVDSARRVEGTYTPFVSPEDEDGKLGPIARPDNKFTSSSPWRQSNEVEVGVLGEGGAVASLVEGGG